MIDLGRWESMAKPNYQYEKRQKDLAKQRKKQEKEQEKALRKANKVDTGTSAAFAAKNQCCQTVGLVATHRGE